MLFLDHDVIEQMSEYNARWLKVEFWSKVYYSEYMDHWKAGMRWVAFIHKEFSIHVKTSAFETKLCSKVFDMPFTFSLHEGL